MSAVRAWNTARSLWREEPRWRYTVVAAGLATLGALFTSDSSGGASGGGGVVPPPPGGGGQMVVQPTAAIDPGVDGRLRKFFQAYTDASAPNAPAGARCEQLAGAYLGLEPSDEALARSARASAIADAKRCLPLIDDSNGRVAPVEAASKRFAEVRSVAAAQAVLEAAEHLTDFDRTRQGVSDDKLVPLRAAVTTYRQALERAATLASLYRPDDPATLVPAQELAQIDATLAALPFAAEDAGLGAPQRMGRAAAATAAAALRDSEQRIAVLRAAFERRAQDPVGLALALGALGAFDLARMRGAAPGTAVDIGEAQRAARDSIGTALERMVQAYAKAATFETATQLTQLGVLAKTLDARVAPEVLARIEQASSDLAGSRVRLQALRDVASRWLQAKASGARNADVETRLAQVSAALVPAGAAEPNGFDAAAMNAQDRAALASVLGASLEIQGRVPPGQRRALALALEPPPNADATALTFCASVGAELERLGFAIAKRAGDAAVVVKLSAPGIQEGGTSAQGWPQRKASASGSMVWTYSGKTLDLGAVTGVGADRDRRALTAAALRSAAEQMARAVLERVERGT